MPFCGWRQRASASAPLMRPLANSTLGLEEGLESIHSPEVHQDFALGRYIAACETGRRGPIKRCGRSRNG